MNVDDFFGGLSLDTTCFNMSLTSQLTPITQMCDVLNLVGSEEQQYLSRVGI